MPPPQRPGSSGSRMEDGVEARGVADSSWGLGPELPPACLPYLQPFALAPSAPTQVQVQLQRPMLMQMVCFIALSLLLLLFILFLLPPTLTSNLHCATMLPTALAHPRPDPAGLRSKEASARHLPGANVKCLKCHVCFKEADNGFFHRSCSRRMEPHPLQRHHRSRTGATLLAGLSHRFDDIDDRFH